MARRFSLRNFLCEYSLEEDDMERDTANEPSTSAAAVSTSSGGNNNAEKKRRLPMLHVFGITPSGEKACVHVHSVLPYVLFRVCAPTLTPRVEENMARRLNHLIQKDLSKESKFAKPDWYTPNYIHHIETVEAKSIYGYQEHDELFAKVYLFDPAKVFRLMSALNNELEKFPYMQPFEAHVPYILQFFIDHSIFGMDDVHFSKVQLRVADDRHNDEIYNGELTVGQIRRNKELRSRYAPMTTCAIECDAFGTDIINAELHKNNVYSTNPGLEYLWREEAVRCEHEGRELVNTLAQYTARPYRIQNSEAELLKELKSAARKLVEKHDDLANRTIVAGGGLDDTVIELQSQGSDYGNDSEITAWSQELDDDDGDENDPDRTLVGNRQWNPDPFASFPDEATTSGMDGEASIDPEASNLPIADEGTMDGMQPFQAKGSDQERAKEMADVEAQMTQSVASPAVVEEETTLNEEIDEFCEVISTEMRITRRADIKTKWITLNMSLPLRVRDASATTMGRKTKILETGQNPDEGVSDVSAMDIDEIGGMLDEDDEERASQWEHQQSINSALANASLRNNMRLDDSPFDSTTLAESQSSNIDDVALGESEIANLCVASLELLIFTEDAWPDPKVNAIIGASLVIFADVCRESTPTKRMFISCFVEEFVEDMTDVYLVPDEENLFHLIGQTVHEYDVEFLIGYDIKRLSWGYLKKRSEAIGMLNYWTALSRCIALHRDSDDDLSAPHGRLLQAVWKIVRADLQLRSYDRGTACLEVLRTRFPIFPENILCERFFTGTIRNQILVIEYMLRCASVNVELLIEMNWFIKTATMARVYGIQLHEVWTRGSQLRVESMLLRLSRRLGYLAPSILPDQRNKMCAPEQLQLILEPESKVYFDPVIVLDFQSLYPSMAIAYNYCFSTLFGKVPYIERFASSHDDKTMEVGALQQRTPDVPALIDCVGSRQIHVSPLSAAFAKIDRRDGVVPILLREILAARLMVKNSMKHTTSKKLRRILDARQLALKLVANVTYGYTAANWSGRMPCVEIADAILGKGRETLERAIELVNGGEYSGARVIYGDTDSLFVLVPGATLEQAFAVGRRIAADVGEQNPCPVLLKLEKVYTGCVLETKKRYAGWMFESEKDTGCLDAKGIEVIRRDTCPIVTKILTRSLELIFARRWEALNLYLDHKLTNLRSQPITDFVFCKEYKGPYSEHAKVPQEKIVSYYKKKSPAYEPLRGERIPYIIVEGGPDAIVYSCVRSMPEFFENTDLKVNLAYYVRAHIMAALKRVVDLIPLAISWTPPYASHCTMPGCRVVGQKPWCIYCEKKTSAFQVASVLLAEESRIRATSREACLSCTELNVFDMGRCQNLACPANQAWLGSKRTKARQALVWLEKKQRQREQKAKQAEAALQSTSSSGTVQKPTTFAKPALPPRRKVPTPAAATGAKNKKNVPPPPSGSRRLDTYFEAGSRQPDTYFDGDPRRFDPYYEADTPWARFDALVMGLDPSSIYSGAAAVPSGPSGNSATTTVATSKTTTVSTTKTATVATTVAPTKTNTVSTGSSNHRAPPSSTSRPPAISSSSSSSAAAAAPRSSRSRLSQYFPRVSSSKEAVRGGGDEAAGDDEIPFVDFDDDDEDDDEIQIVEVRKVGPRS